MSRLTIFTRRSYPARSPLPPGYAVEYWDCDEHWHWVLKAHPDDVYSDACWNHWDCWRGAWAHARGAVHSETEVAGEAAPSPAGSGRQSQ